MTGQSSAMFGWSLTEVSVTNYYFLFIFFYNENVKKNIFDM